MQDRRSKVVLVMALLGVSLVTGCKDHKSKTAGGQTLTSIPGADPRAIVVLEYLDHRQGLAATAKWPRVAFAIGDGTLLLTAAHCVDDFQKSSAQVVSTDIVAISPYYGDIFDFEIVAVDKQADVAILRAPWPSHPALTLATEEELLAARSILLAGRPQAGQISKDLQTELLPISDVNEAAPSQAIRLRGTRLVARGWSGSAMLIPESGKVAGVLGRLNERPARRVLFFRFSRSDAMGCSVRPIYSLLRRHGLATAALGHPGRLDAIPDSERAFSCALDYFQALFSNDSRKMTASASELTRLRPRSVQAHLLAGMVAVVRKDSSVALSEEQFSRAESSYKAALAIDPDHAHAHAIYGNFLIMRSRNAEALVQSEAALAIDPNNRLALFNRLILLPLDQRENAAERLVAMDPNDPFCWYYYGATLLRLGQMENALRAARKAVDLDPNGLFYGGLGDVLAALGRADEAEPCYKRMTERCGCEQCWYRYALFLGEHREERLDEAWQALKTAESKGRSGKVSPKNMNLLRLQLLEKSSPPEAEALAHRLLEAEPSDAHYWWHLAGILRAQEKYPQAVEAADKAVRLRPNGSFQPRLANCLAKAGRLQEAQGTYDEMLRLHPDRPKYWCWYAEFLLDYFADRVEEARLALQKAEAATDRRWSASADEIHRLQERLDPTEPASGSD
jgi:tetratricopeptide (TPR) repeat protein